MYYSDPGDRRHKHPQKNTQSVPSSEKYLGYYSEPDAKYLEIDYEFLKQLSKLAEINLKYRRKTTRNKVDPRTPSSSLERNYVLYEKLPANRYELESEEPVARVTRRKSKGASKRPSKELHCESCCSVCKSSKKNDTVSVPCACATSEGRRDQSSRQYVRSTERKRRDQSYSSEEGRQQYLKISENKKPDQPQNSEERKNLYSFSSGSTRRNKSQSSEEGRQHYSYNTESRWRGRDQSCRQQSRGKCCEESRREQGRSSSGERSRRDSVHSVKSVSFIEDTEPKSPNYTGKSFTNDLKQFLLGPSSSRFSLKGKLLTGLRTSLDERGRSRRKPPSVALIKGLWKSL